MVKKAISFGATPRIGRSAGKLPLSAADFGTMGPCSGTSGLGGITKGKNENDYNSDGLLWMGAGGNSIAG